MHINIYNDGLKEKNKRSNDFVFIIVKLIIPIPMITKVLLKHVPIYFIIICCTLICTTVLTVTGKREIKLVTDC